MFDAIVLAGGAARRMDGADKPALEVGGVSLLDRVLAAVDGASSAIVVGPPRAVARDVTWCREEPPGGGPVAAVAAGLPHVRADVVLVLGADLPSIAPAVTQLLTALHASPADAAALVDDTGRVNYVAAAWRTASLRRALGDMPDVAGASMRSLVTHAETVEVPDRGGWARDCDTWDDLDAARRAEQGSTS